MSSNQPLLWLTPKDEITQNHTFQGTLIVGSSGGGKTTGSGHALAMPMLRSGFGFLVLCYKPGESELWIHRAKKVGREKDVIVFSPKSSFRFNFMQYEATREGDGAGQVENLVNLILQIVEIVEGKVDFSGDSAFWIRAMKELCRNAIDLILLSGLPMSLETISEIVAYAPQSKEEVNQLIKSVETASSIEECETMIQKAFWLMEAKEDSYSELQSHDRRVVMRYWLSHFANLSDRTRTGITATFTSLSDILGHGMAYNLMGTDLNITPEATYKEGKIIIIDTPISEWHDVGKVIAGIWKYMFQRAILRRDTRRYPRPVALWIDEAQGFLSSYDPVYVALARDRLAATVLLTQSISAIHSVLGRHEHTQTLLSNLSLQIYHAQMDGATNKYASDTISSGRVIVPNFHSSQAGASGGGSEQIRPKVLPEVFTRLAKGGAPNFLVEAIVFQGGRIFRATGDTWIKCVFRQGF